MWLYGWRACEFVNKSLVTLYLQFELLNRAFEDVCILPESMMISLGDAGLDATGGE